MHAENYLWNHEDIGEDNDSIHVVPTQWLQTDFDGNLRDTAHLNTRHQYNK